MSTQRIITRETPAVWYHKGEVVTETAIYSGQQIVHSVTGTPWNSTSPTTIVHDDVEWANLVRNSKTYTVSK